MKAPPRVIHLLATLDPGGVERSVYELTTHLDPDRFRSEVWFLAGGGTLKGAFETRGVATRRVALLNSWDLTLVPRLTARLRNAGAQILHTHQPAATAFGRLAAPHAGLKALITTEHSVIHWSEPGRFLNRLIRVTAGRADQVVAVSRAVEYLTRGAGALVPGKSRVIPDGVSLPGAGTPVGRRAARARFHLPDAGPLVATLGRLLPHKGLSNLIEMMPLVLSERGDALFAIAGDGPERPGLEARARALGVADRLVFTGAVSDPYEFLPAVDVFVLPSLTEGGGIGALEAMAHGIPVVATHVGGIPEFLESAGALMVNPNAPREMAAVVLYLLSSPLYTAEVGGAGRSWIERGGPGSARHMADQYAALYAEMLGGAGEG